MDRIKQDDVLSARELSAKDKLGQALDLTAYGLELKRQNLTRQPDCQ